MKRTPEETVKKATMYLLKELEEDFGVLMANEVSPTHAVIYLDDRTIKVSASSEGKQEHYNLIMGLDQMEKKDGRYYLPFRLIEGLLAKISYDNLARAGQVK